MLGAPKYHLAVICLFIGIGCPASAIELGNILFQPTAERSREASALALDAISDAIKAFEKRELDDPKGSQQLMAQSREKLKAAGNKMVDILKSGSTDTGFRRYLDDGVYLEKQLSKGDYDFFISWAKEAGATTIKNRGQVFQVFTTHTFQLGDFLENPQNDFRKATDQIGNYFKGGDITTRLMREK